MHTRTHTYSVLQLVLSNPDGGDKCPALERLSVHRRRSPLLNRSIPSLPFGKKTVLYWVASREWVWHESFWAVNIALSWASDIFSWSCAKYLLSLSKGVEAGWTAELVVYNKEKLDHPSLPTPPPRIRAVKLTSAGWTFLANKELEPDEPPSFPSCQELLILLGLRLEYWAHTVTIPVTVTVYYACRPSAMC